MGIYIKRVSVKVWNSVCDLREYYVQNVYLGLKPPEGTASSQLYYAPLNLINLAKLKCQPLTKRVSGKRGDAILSSGSIL